jgi:hypothetical protein
VPRTTGTPVASTSVSETTSNVPAPRTRYPTLADIDSDGTSFSPVGGRKGSQPLTDEARQPELVWHVEDGARKNYEKLGILLAEAGDLYWDQSNGLGLIKVLPNGKTSRLSKAADLAPSVVDRVDMVVVRNGKVSGEPRNYRSVRRHHVGTAEPRISRRQGYSGLQV